MLSEINECYVKMIELKKWHSCPRHLLSASRSVFKLQIYTPVYTSVYLTHINQEHLLQKHVKE